MARLDRIKKETTGFILAGGKSERFGSDKRKQSIGGITLLQRTISIVEGLLSMYPFVVGDNLDGFQIDSKYIINDARKDCGPLGGLVAALEKSPTRWGLIIAVDLPDITGGDLEYILSQAEDNFDVISLSSGVLPEPLVALYNINCASFWRGRLVKNRLSISDGLNDLRVKIVQPPRGSRSLRNVNRLKDI